MKTKQQTQEAQVSSRRAFVLLGVGALASGGLIAKALAASAAAPAASAAKPGPDVEIENFSPAGKSTGVVRVARVAKSDAEWSKQLSDKALLVTRHAGTEVSYTGKYWNNHADGLYRCICCDTALFDSKTKFESGTGWPSFWQPISTKNVVSTLDTSYGWQRNAVSCARCDAHLGHVFDDGPQPTGLRYCMNSVSLQFVARG